MDRLPMISRPLLSDELIEAACEHMRQGARSPLVALQLAGCSKRTSQRWQAWAREGIEPYVGCWRRVQRAQLAQQHQQRRRAAKNAAESDEPPTSLVQLQDYNIALDLDVARLLAGELAPQFNEMGQRIPVEV